MAKKDKIKGFILIELLAVIVILTPTYVPFIIIWCIYAVCTGIFEPIYIIGNLFGNQDFSASELILIGI